MDNSMQYTDHAFAYSSQNLNDGCDCSCCDSDNCC